MTNLKQHVQAVLVLFGWSAAEDSSAIAFRDYPTAVGVKRAWVYVYPPGPFHTSLHGDYWSEGRNVLEATPGALLPNEASEATVTSQVTLFAAKADQAVRQSYAARLLALFPELFGQQYRPAFSVLGSERTV